MKIILLADVYKHGVAGEIVDVANGFARNYLIPKGLATQANDGEMKRTERVREAAQTRRLEYEAMLNELGRKIDGANLIFFRRAASTGKLFGSVTTQDIALELDRVTGVDINRRRVSQQPLRDAGLHEVPVRLGTDVSPVLNVRIVAEDQSMEYQRQLAAIEEGILENIQFDADGKVVPQNLDRLRAKIEKAEAEAEAAEELEAAQAAIEVNEEANDDVPPASDYADDGDEYDDIPPASDFVDDEEDEYDDDED